MGLFTFFKNNYKLSDPMQILFFSVIVFCLVTSYIYIHTHTGNINNITNTLLPLYYIISFFLFFIILNKLQATNQNFLTSFTFIFQMFMFIYHITLLVFVTMEYNMHYIHLFLTKFFMTLCLFLSILNKKNTDENSDNVGTIEIFSKFITMLLTFTYIYIFYRSIYSTFRS